MRAIIIIATYLDPTMCSFLQNMTNEEYHVYVSVDSNNSIEIETFELIKSEYPYLRIINISESESCGKGYRGSVMHKINNASSRCKALYYFCELNRIHYDSYWFIEYDVFIPSVRTLPYLDNKYPDSIDLLSNEYSVSEIDSDEWHWHLLRNLVPFPWAGGPIMAIRVSNQLLQEIKSFVKSKEQLVLDELLFHTIALQKKLNMVTAPELKHVVFSAYNNWNIKDINEYSLFHPLKHYEDHITIAYYFGFER
jgi:hypothetical protein